MSVPPRSPAAALMRAPDWRRVLTLGLSLAGVIVAVYLVLLNRGFSTEAARSGGLIAMIAGQVLLVLVERAGAKPIWRVTLRGNNAVLPIVAITAVSLAAAILWPPLSEVLHLATIPLSVAAAACAAGAIAVLWTQPLYVRA